MPPPYGNSGRPPEIIRAVRRRRPKASAPHTPAGTIAAAAIPPPVVAARAREAPRRGAATVLRPAPTGPWVHVGGLSASSGGSVSSLSAPPVSVLAGDLIVVSGVIASGGTPGSVSDSQANGYSLAATAADAAARVYTWYARAQSDGSPIVSVAETGASVIDLSVRVYRYLPGGPIAVAGTASNSATASSSPTAGPIASSAGAVALDHAVAAAWNTAQGAATPGAGYNLRDSIALVGGAAWGLAVEDRLDDASGSATPALTFASATNWIELATVFVPAARTIPAPVVARAVEPRRRGSATVLRPVARPAVAARPVPAAIFARAIDPGRRGAAAVLRPVPPYPATAARPPLRVAVARLADARRRGQAAVLRPIPAATTTATRRVSTPVVARPVDPRRRGQAAVLRPIPRVVVPTRAIPRVILARPADARRRGLATTIEVFGPAAAQAPGFLWPLLIRPVRRNPFWLNLGWSSYVFEWCTSDGGDDGGGGLPSASTFMPASSPRRWAAGAVAPWPAVPVLGPPAPPPPASPACPDPAMATWSIASAIPDPSSRGPDPSRSTWARGRGIPDPAQATWHFREGTS